MEWISDPQIWIAFLTLTALEIVLGIDNVVFISILAGKLPVNQQARARQVGLGLAMLMRIGLLFSISWLVSLTDSLFEVFTNEISGRDLILLGGGLFLIAKSTFEIHERLEGEGASAAAKSVSSFTGVIIQILLLDMVFSLDSVITAVGLVDELGVMVAAVVVAVGVMLLSAGLISRFVHEHPTVKMLALSFLLLIGFSLVAEGLDVHIPKGYIYFAMGFSIFVEAINLRVRSGMKKRNEPPVELRESYISEEGGIGPTAV
jgi:predicted tellurium resistance membrane protein TerC